MKRFILMVLVLGVFGYNAAMADDSDTTYQGSWETESAPSAEETQPVPAQEDAPAEDTTYDSGDDTYSY